jgi:hypothetical protein
MRGMRTAALAAVAAFFLAGCSGGGDSSLEGALSPEPTAHPSSEAPKAATPVPTAVPGVAVVDYSDPSGWLCRPGKMGTPCDGPYDTTVLLPGGATRVDQLPAASSPPIDCFYVYPTVSTDSGVNSDLTPDAAERNTTIAQAAPFGQACRLFVPVYRQVTVSALTTGRFADPQGAATAYGDVVAAWRYYLAHDNAGRGVVLIGHSQGAMVLRKLIMEYVDPDAEVRGRLVSAVLAGTTVNVPPGKDVGGDFKNIPACRERGQRGCVVTFATFNSASPPPVLSLFGRASVPGMEALCVNPAALGRDGTGKLSFWLSAASFRFFAGSGAASQLDPKTPYAVAEGLIDATCASSGQFSYLSVSVNADGAALGLPLPAFLTGEVWGLHILDLSLPMGNPVELVRAQAER